MNSNNMISNTIRISAFCLLTFTWLASNPDRWSYAHISDTPMVFDLEKYQGNLIKESKRYQNIIKRVKQFKQNIPEKTIANFIVFRTGDNYKNRITKLNTESKPFSRFQIGGLTGISQTWLCICLTEKNTLVSEHGKVENELILQINTRDEY